MPKDFDIKVPSEDVRISEGFYSKLSFSVSIDAKNPSRKGTYLENISGRLFYAEDEGLTFIGDLSPATFKVYNFSRSNKSKQVVVGIELPSDKIEMIEDKRGRGDVEFKIVLDLAVRESNSDGLGELTSQTVKEEVKVFQSQWLNLIQRSEYNEVSVFEIPAPFDFGGSEELKEAKTQLEEAFTKFRNRNNPMNACRMVIENLSQVMDESDIDKTTKEQIEDLLDYTRDYLSMGSHNNSGDRESGQKNKYGIPESGVDGSDWLMGLRLTASAYQRIAVAIEET